MPDRVSFQLYSARNSPLAATLKMVAGIGYRDVEGYGGVYDDPLALRAGLDANGLAMPTGHFDLEMLETGRPKVLAIAATLGISHIYAPYLAEAQRPKTAAGWTKFGKRLAAVGEWLRSEGYGFGWHNHDFEFARLPNGALPLDLIFAAAPLLDWEIDVAWVVRVAQNPLSWIKTHAGRITSVHVKDIAPAGHCLDEDGWADVGTGTVNWGRCFAALKKTRAMHLIVEHDNPNDLARFARRSFGAVKGAGQPDDR